MFHWPVVQGQEDELAAYNLGVASGCLLLFGLFLPLSSDAPAVAAASRMAASYVGLVPGRGM
jgi:hypothetical protein